MKTVYLMYETIPLPVISSGGIMPLEDTAKAATATRSREIFLVVGNTGLFNAFHLSRFAANAPPQPSAAPPVGQCYSVKRFTQAYVITTCAFFVCKKSLGLQKNIKTSKKGLTNPQKFEAPPVSKGTTPIVNKEDLL